MMTVRWDRFRNPRPGVVMNVRLARSVLTSLEERLEAGCWRVYASYKEATLTYVYQKH